MMSAKLEMSIKLTPMDDGLPKELNACMEFDNDDDAIDQYWAALKGITGETEVEERKSRASKKGKGPKAQER
jgi:hypothetical protein